jgi:hypothetical protein
VSAPFKTAITLLSRQKLRALSRVLREQSDTLSSF